MSPSRTFLGPENLEPPAYPPYSGIDTNCPKCTCPLVGHEHESTIQCISNGGYTLEKAYEYMKRICLACGYAWREQCADAT